jgi:hypothetical protein
MEIIKKHWALIGFVIALLVDDNTGLIAYAFENTVAQNIVRGLGAILLAYYWNPNNSAKKIGGGGAVIPNKGF